MGRAAKRSTITRITQLFFQFVLIGTLLACAGKDGGMGAAVGGADGGTGFAGGALDAAGSGTGITDGTTLTQNQAAPLSEGNLGSKVDYSKIFILMSCVQSLCYKAPDIEGLSNEASDEPKECPYLLKAHVQNNFITNSIGQVVDRDKNEFRYFKINNLANFQFLISVDANPHVEFYVTDIDYSTLVTDTWFSCGLPGDGKCPQPGWTEMHPMFEDISCDFLKTKPESRQQIQIQDSLKPINKFPELNFNK